MSERNDKIIELWNQEYSASEIAKHLNLTKNIVIGVITRSRDSGSGLIVRPKLDGPVRCGMRRKRVSHKKRPGADPVRAVSLPKLFQKPLKHERPDLRIVGIPLWELERRSCRYPTSRVDEQHYFCGETTKDMTSSYCEKHHSIVWVKKKRLKSEDLTRLKVAYDKKQWLKGVTAAKVHGGN